jgi:hypothetical protein
VSGRRKGAYSRAPTRYLPPADSYLHPRSHTSAMPTHTSAARLAHSYLWPRSSLAHLYDGQISPSSTEGLQESLLAFGWPGKDLTRRDRQPVVSLDSSSPAHVRAREGPTGRAKHCKRFEGSDGSGQKGSLAFVAFVDGLAAYRCFLSQVVALVAPRLLSSLVVFVDRTSVRLSRLRARRACQKPAMEGEKGHAEIPVE